MKAVNCAEKGLPVQKLMEGLFNRENADKDVVIAAIARNSQQEGMKRLFHRKTIAELFELYPSWRIDKMDKCDEVCSTYIVVHVIFTIPSLNTVFDIFDDRPRGHIQQTSSVH